MSDIVLGLGPIVFRDFEVPAGISFGGRQKLAVHELADGRRIIDCMGRRDADIEFSGTLSGPDASFRARELDQLRVFALPQPLTWDVFCFTVMLRELSLSYQNDKWIPYRIRCAVQQDETLVPGVAAELVSTSADINTAAIESSAAGLDLDLSVAHRIGYVTIGTEEYYEIKGELETADSALRTGISEQDLRLSQAGLGSQSPEGALQALSDGADVLHRLALLVRARSYFTRATTILAPENFGL